MEFEAEFECEFKCELDEERASREAEAAEVLATVCDFDRAYPIDTYPHTYSLHLHLSLT